MHCSTFVTKVASIEFNLLLPRVEVLFLSSTNASSSQQQQRTTRSLTALLLLSGPLDTSRTRRRQPSLKLTLSTTTTPTTCGTLLLNLGGHHHSRFPLARLSASLDGTLVGMQCRQMAEVCCTTSQRRYLCGEEQLIEVHGERRGGAHGGPRSFSEKSTVHRSCLSAKNFTFNEFVT